MTREKALKVANALYAIENFELLADDLEQVIAKHEEHVPDIDIFRDRLMDIIVEETQRLNGILEKL